MKTELIIVHPGSAHFDEMTAIALILASFPEQAFTVERREPTVSELDDPEIWVVDTGDRHEPERRNFDHHHALDCPAAFVLVADYLGLLETMRVLPWWDFKDQVDRFGPQRASERFDAGDILVNRNPVEDWLTAAFAADPKASLPLLRAFGANIIGQARLLEKQIAFWKGCRRIAIGGVSALIGETAESAGLEEFQRLEKDPPAIVISLDRRGGGWRLFRFEGAPVDFSRLAGRAEIAFAHKSGFMAKTNGRLPLDELLSLVKEAVTVYS